MRIKTFTSNQSQSPFIEIFGYSSHGVPGIEINGNVPKILKQKLIFLTRYYQIKLPMRRFVLCLDDSLFSKGVQYQHHFELPFMILLWSLGGITKFKKFDDCVSAGSFDLNGVIYPLSLDSKKADLLRDYNLKWIGDEYNHLPSFDIEKILPFINHST